MGPIAGGTGPPHRAGRLLPLLTTEPCPSPTEKSVGDETGREGRTRDRGGVQPAQPPGYAAKNGAEGRRTQAAHGNQRRHHRGSYKTSDRFLVHGDLTMLLASTYPSLRSSSNRKAKLGSSAHRHRRRAHPFA